MTQNYRLDKIGLINRDKKISFSLIGLLPDRMPEVLLTLAGIDPDKRVADISKKERETVIQALKDVRISPGKPRPMSEAVVASGGVDVDEINPATMESRIVKNVFITGELLDIDGDSGGYNLQFAWSSGAVAGMAQ